MEQIQNWSYGRQAQMLVGLRGANSDGADIRGSYEELREDALVR